MNSHSATVIKLALGLEDIDVISDVPSENSSAGSENIWSSAKIMSDSGALSLHVCQIRVYLYFTRVSGTTWLCILTIRFDCMDLPL